MVTIILYEQAVIERHRKSFTILQSWLTDSSWIQLIRLIKWIWYKIEKNAISIVQEVHENLHLYTTSIDIKECHIICLLFFAKVTQGVIHESQIRLTK